jgi:hypothetical protein
MSLDPHSQTPWRLLAHGGFKSSHPPARIPRPLGRKETPTTAAYRYLGMGSNSDRVLEAQELRLGFRL